MNVFFRPEEVHGTSGIAQVFVPSPEWNSYIPHDTVRISIQNDAVFHFQSNRLPTIQTGRIDSNRLTRKEPADRQRFECSLAEPLLLAVNGDTVLSGQVIERRKGCDQIRIRIEPAWNHF